MLNDLFWIVPVCAIIALLFARIFFKGMMKESEGTDTMKRIAGHVRKGAMAYLRFLLGWLTGPVYRIRGFGLRS